MMLLKQILCAVLNRHEWFVTQPEVLGYGRKERVCQRCGLRQIELSFWSRSF